MSIIASNAVLLGRRWFGHEVVLLFVVGEWSVVAGFASSARNGGAGVGVCVGAVVGGAAAAGTVGGVERGELISCWFKTAAVVVSIVGVLTFVADVLMAVSAANIGPAKGAGNVFDNVPRIEGFSESTEAETATLICGLGVRKKSRGGFGGDDRGAFDIVWLPRKGPEMKDGEDGHFDAKEHGRYANLDIRGLNCLAGFNGTGGGEKGDKECLPEREEDDELDSGDFE